MGLYQLSLFLSLVYGAHVGEESMPVTDRNIWLKNYKYMFGLLTVNIHGTDGFFLTAEVKEEYISIYYTAYWNYILLTGWLTSIYLLTLQHSAVSILEAAILI